MELDIIKETLGQQVEGHKLTLKREGDQESSTKEAELGDSIDFKHQTEENYSYGATRKILDRIKLLMTEKDLVKVTKTKDELLDSTLIYFSLIQIRVNIIYKPICNINDSSISLLGVRDWDQLRCFLGKLAVLFSKYPRNILDSLKNKKVIICQQIIGAKEYVNEPEIHIFQLNQYDNLEIQLYEFVLNSNGNNLSLSN